MAHKVNDIPRKSAPKVRERDVERYLANLVKGYGGLSLKLLPLHFAGLPDRLVIFPGGIVLFVEVKAPDGKLSAVQKIAHRRLADLGCHVHTVVGFEGVDRLLSLIYPDD